MTLAEAWVTYAACCATVGPSLWMVVGGRRGAARVDHVLDLGEGRLLTTGIKLAWAHELADTGSTTSANFVGAANARFAVQGAERARDSALVGVGSALKLDAMSSVYVP